MFRDVNLHAIFFNPEIHPEAKTFKEFHDDLEVAINDIRNTFPAADEDTGFKQAADAITQAIPFGRNLESVNPNESGKIELKRAGFMKKMGDSGLVEVTGEPSKALAKKFAGFYQDFIDKKYWPDRNCRKDLFGVALLSIFNQSYLTAYVQDYPRLVPVFQRHIATLQSRIETYENNIKTSNKL
jgi:hypothetical protein